MTSQEDLVFFQFLKENPGAMAFYNMVVDQNGDLESKGKNKRSSTLAKLLAQEKSPGKGLKSNNPQVVGKSPRKSISATNIMGRSPGKPQATVSLSKSPGKPNPQVQFRPNVEVKLSHPNSGQDRSNRKPFGDMSSSRNAHPALYSVKDITTPLVDKSVPLNDISRNNNKGGNNRTPATSPKRPATQIPSKKPETAPKNTPSHTRSQNEPLSMPSTPRGPLVVDLSVIFNYMVNMVNGITLKNRSSKMKKFKASFYANELVDWILYLAIGKSRKVGVHIGKEMCKVGLIEHAFKGSSYEFEDEKELFCLTTKGKLVRVQQSLPYFLVIFDSQSGVEIRDRIVHLKKYKTAFVGSEFVDWLLRENIISDRTRGEVIGKTFLEFDLIQHVTANHHFKDSSTMFYHLTRRGINYRMKINGVSAATMKKTRLELQRKNNLDIFKTVNNNENIPQDCSVLEIGADIIIEDFEKDFDFNENDITGGITSPGGEKFDKLQKAKSSIDLLGHSVQSTSSSSSNLSLENHFKTCTPVFFKQFLVYNGRIPEVHVLDFYLKIEKLRAESSLNEQSKLKQEICQSFLKEGAPQFVVIPKSLNDNLLKLLSNSNDQLPLSLLSEVQVYLLALLNNFVPGYLKSSQYSKSKEKEEIQPLIITNETERSEVTEVKSVPAKSDRTVMVLLDFCFTVSSFKAAFSTNTVEQRIAHADQIYQKYFSRDNPLISEVKPSHIDEVFEMKQSGMIKPELFDKIQNEIGTILNKYSQYSELFKLPEVKKTTVEPEPTLKPQLPRSTSKLSIDNSDSKPSIRLEASPRNEEPGVKRYDSLRKPKASESSRPELKRVPSVHKFPSENNNGKELKRVASSQKLFDSKNNKDKLKKTTSSQKLTEPKPTVVFSDAEEVLKIPSRKSREAIHDSLKRHGSSSKISKTSSQSSFTEETSSVIESSESVSKISDVIVEKSSPNIPLPISIVLRRFEQKRGGVKMMIPNTFDELLNQAGEKLKIKAVCLREPSTEAQITEMYLLKQDHVVWVMTAEDEKEFQ